MADIAEVEERITGWIDRRAPWLWDRYPDVGPIDIVMLELDSRVPRNAAGAVRNPYKPGAAHVPPIKPGSPEARKIMEGG